MFMNKRRFEIATLAWHLDYHLVNGFQACPRIEFSMKIIFSSKNIHSSLIGVGDQKTTVLHAWIHVQDENSANRYFFVLVVGWGMGGRSTSNSKFGTKLRNLIFLGGMLIFQKMFQDWKSPKAKQCFDVLMLFVGFSRNKIWQVDFSKTYFEWL